MGYKHMRRYGRHSGVTLSELLVVMGVMTVLAVLAVPTGKKMVDSFESSSGVRQVIGAALSNARAIAAKEGHYAGVRFQQDLNGDQYMIFIIHDPAAAPSNAQIAADPYVTGTGLANGFRAIQGRKPIKLPPNIGVLDLRLVTRTSRAAPLYTIDYSETVLNTDNLLNTANLIPESSTFSVVFSPSGKLSLQEVRVRNRHGIPDTLTRTGDISTDDIFNKQDRVFAGQAMFLQDDYLRAWWSPVPTFANYGPEMSRNCFVIYDKKRLAATAAAQRWTDYLQELDPVYVNPHTGELVNN
ncbi:MAG: hypothetical protein IH624_11865 [Phycisphaerae bacterium]|nr:hypothetical protein [Phycisphaerae bacterium]